jgi:hypothetical protein
MQIRCMTLSRMPLRIMTPRITTTLSTGIQYYSEQQINSYSADRCANGQTYTHFGNGQTDGQTDN